MKILLMMCPMLSESEKFLKVSEKISSALEGKMTALCVSERIAHKYYSPYSIQLKGTNRKREKEIFSNVKRVLKDRDIRRIKRGGEPVSQMLDIIEKQEYSMLIYGDVGWKTTKKIAEYVYIPTFIHRTGEDLKSFLIAADGSENSIRAAVFAGKLANNLGAEINLLSVGKDESERDSAEECLKRTRKAMEESNIEDLKYQVKIGPVSDTILEEAKEHDVVVLSPRGLSKLHRIVIGNISLKVLENASSNILLIR